MAGVGAGRAAAALFGPFRLRASFYFHGERAPTEPITRHIDTVLDLTQASRAPASSAWDERPLTRDGLPRAGCRLERRRFGRGQDSVGERRDAPRFLNHAADNHDA